MAEELRNEFAAVHLEVVTLGNGPVLMITDLKSGASAQYDPLELETLVYLSAAERTHLLDPATTRWSGEGDAPSETAEYLFDTYFHPHESEPSSEAI